MIEVSHIYKRFNKDYLFEDFSLIFKENQVTSLIGPSGCGKTTLLRMMAGLESYESGSISGIDQSKVSFVFQEDRLLPWLSVYQNIALVLKAKCTPAEVGEKVSAVLALLDLSAASDMMPFELSGGMQRRVAIGRALAYDGSVIFLDEPFKGMDDKLKGEVLEELATAWNKTGKTVILVTHDLVDARRLSDTIYELGGRPLAQIGVLD